MKKVLLAGALLGALALASAVALPAAALPPDAGGPAHRCNEGCPAGHTQPREVRAGPPRPDAPAQGPEDARITVEVWSDFQCPFCARGAGVLRELRARYGEQLRVVFRHMPLPFHPEARLAAEASMAAHAQGRFWEFHDALFARPGALDRAGLEAHAAAVGLDVEAFRRALDRGEGRRHVEEDLAEGRRRGITGTPTFFVNGTPVVGARSLETFTSLIDAQRAR